MKLLTNTLTASALLLAIGSTATAAVSPNIVQEVRAAAGSASQLNVIVNDTTVTLTGYAEDGYSLNQATRVARENGAEKVLNHAVRTR